MACVRNCRRHARRDRARAASEAVPGRAATRPATPTAAATRTRSVRIKSPNSRPFGQRSAPYRQDRLRELGPPPAPFAAQKVACVAMVSIHHEGCCSASLDIAFDYIDDHRTTVDWMFGLSRFVPVTEQERGLGAVFDATFQVKPITLHSTLECTDYEEQVVIGFSSISGFTNSSSWRFHPISDEENEDHRGLPPTSSPAGWRARPWAGPSSRSSRCPSGTPMPRCPSTSRRASIAR